jgi:transposase-like protein
MVAAESLGKNRIGRIRLELTSNGQFQMIKFAQRVVVPGSTIKTDGARELRRLSGLSFDQQYFTQLGSNTPAHIDLPAVHLVASLLTRWLIGTMHYGVSREQLGYYLDEFTFRFNRRTSKSRGLLFYRLIQQSVQTTPHPMKDLLIPTKDFS